MARWPSGITMDVRDCHVRLPKAANADFGLTAEQMRRLAGLPPEGAGDPVHPGPGLEEIAARKMSEHTEHQRQMLASAGYSPEQLANWPSTSSAENVAAKPRHLPVGTRVMVPLPRRFGVPHHERVSGTVFATNVTSDLVEVELDEPVGGASVVVVSRDAVSPLPILTTVETTRPFQVGDLVRLVGMHEEAESRYAPLLGRDALVQWAGKLPNGRQIVRIEIGGHTIQPYVENVALVRRSGDAVPAAPSQPLALARPDETWAATLELAGGLLVEVPGPDPAIWEQVAEQRWGAEEDVRATIRREGDVTLRYARPAGDSNWGGGVVILGHETALCWAKDMARVVNGNIPMGAGCAVARGSLLRSLRTYRRRPPVDPHADRAYPTLRAYLW